MVSTTSAAAQASENEKRRKQTMEKAKANHLSRQLQMRLQYARLKVEHGWQKQNLNEVENLYFHNSYLRGPKPPVPTLATTQQQQHSTFSTPQATFSQSSISFKLGPSSLGRSNVSTNGVNEQNSNIVFQENITPHPASPARHTPDITLSNSNSDPSSRSHPPDDTRPVVVDSQERTPSGISTANSVPASQNASSVDVNIIPGMSPAPALSLTPPQDSQSPIDSPSSLNYYQSAKASRPRTAQKVPSSSKSIPSLTAKDMFNFGSTSTLTYDSFWSSHSGSTTPRPPPRPSGPAELGTSYQIPGDYTNVLQDLGRHSNNSVFTSMSSLPPQQ